VDSSIVWSGFALPAGVSAANVTQIFAYTMATIFGVGGAGGFDEATLVCTAGSATFTLPFSDQNPFTLQPFSISFGSTAGSSIPGITCTGSLSGGDIVSHSLSFNLDTVALIVYYTGSPVAPSSTIAVAPPLSVNSATNTLSLNIPYDYAVASDTSDAYAVTLPAFVPPIPQAGDRILFSPGASNTTTAPTLNVNGFGTFPIAKNPGRTALAVGDIGGNSSVADVIFDGSDFILQNPQTGGGSGGTVTLTGPVTGSGTGTVATTITPTGVTAGSYTNPNFTVNAAGQLTAASNGSSSGSGLSGMTSGQVPIAATATTVTSSKVLAGAGAGITTGPATSVSGDCVAFSGTGGQIADNGSPCGSSSGGLTALTGDVTASGIGSVAATAVNLPGHIALTGTPSTGQVPTATSPTAATWQTPSSGGGLPFQYVWRANCPNSGGTTGTTLFEWAKYSSAGDSSCVETTTIADAGAGAGGSPIIGIVQSGAGTTGFAQIAVSGDAQCQFDSLRPTAQGDLVKVSPNTAGMCASESGGPTNEDPESNVFYATADVAGAASAVFGVDITAIVGNYGNYSAFNTPFLTILAGANNGAQFAVPSALQQDGPTPGGHVSGTPATALFPILPFKFPYANTSVFHFLGQSTVGASGNDFELDTVDHGLGSPANEMFAMRAASYNIPTVQSISGTVGVCQTAVLNIGCGDGNFIFTLAGNATIPTPVFDNPGHISSFEIIQAASGGPFTLTYPSNFINVPTVSAVASSATLFQVMFDGTNWNCISGCASSGSGSGVPSVNGITTAVTIAATSPVSISTAGSTVTIACSSCAGGTGITQLTGGVAAGPGSGSQVATVNSFSTINASAGNSSSPQVTIGNASNNGQFLYVQNVDAVDQASYFGVHDTNNNLTYAVSSTLSGVPGVVAIGGYFNGMGVQGISSSGNHPIFGVLNSAQSSSGVGNTAFGVTDTNVVTTFNSTMDDGSGNTSIPGTSSSAGTKTGAITQNAANNFGGTCSMSASTSCTITLGHTYTTPVCIATQQSATLTGGAVGCVVSGATVTITSAVLNSETWGAFVFGNPN